MTNWVAEMILAQTDVRKRVVVIKHFVAVADVSFPLLPPLCGISLVSSPTRRRLVLTLLGK